MKAFSKVWTAQETELAAKLVAEGASEAMFQAALGRTRQACHDRLRRCQDSFGNIDKSGFAVEQKPKIPAEVIDDRNRRLMAPQPAFGDPPLGFSMLDRKRSAGASA